MTDSVDQHTALMNRFIALANDLKNEGADVSAVANALNSCCAIYSTYAAVGNNSALEESGVEKLVDIYREHLQQAQENRKAEIQHRQQDQQQ